ncbi:MAG: peptide chain release factor N(5)-glutamine methyltransferase [Alcaligenaceae bacterium]|nr:peptide chain release factor N(5)-glutamine methyltransferase [Alcaligenaceae bacterium]
MSSLREFLREGRLAALEARMLWQHVLQVPRSWLIAHDSDPLSDDHIQAYRQLEERRLAGEPMAYILGVREFMGHDFHVSPAVLIPRPDTELLVEKAVTLLQGREGATVLDLGTGSGAIAISIALACPWAHVVATDISGDALLVACKNARNLGADVEFHQGSWYQALPTGKVFDLIVSNPPYIAEGDPHLAQGDLRFEPAAALSDGSDGLDAYREIVAGASACLQAGGSLYVEHGWEQSAQVCDLLRQAGFREVHSLPDLAGILRVSGGHF